jgi:uncharacterized protein YkuJ
MSKILSLGAINKLTGEYVYPKIANKTDEYICSECGKDLILCQGDIRAHHFRHKVDNINPCHHYSNPGESQIHKDAKLLFKTLLESKIQISFVRSCSECKKNEEYEIPETSETSVIKMEYRFEFNGPKVADVVYIDNDEIVCIFEICNTHTTSSENRPEPWFEIDAETLIRTANDNKLSSLQIPCIRSEKCEECLKIENSNLKVHNIEKYVRLKLGQTIFPTPRRKKCENPKLLEFTTTILDDCEVCDNCKYNEWLHQAREEVHLRIDFDAQENVTKNKKILDLFRTDFANKHVVIHTHKGVAAAYIISDSNYKKYDYWKERWDYERMRFPTEHIIDISGKGTVQIIIDLIKYCQRIEPEKRQHQYSDDTAGDFQMMRDMKKQYNRNKSESMLFQLTNDGVLYKECNSVVTIVHPISNIKIRRSAKNPKTYINGKWINVDLDDIINWYRSSDGAIVQCSDCNYLCNIIDNYIICAACKLRTTI